MLFPMFANKADPKSQPGFAEKVSYGLGDFSSCIIYTASQGLLLYYYSDFVQVNIAIVATIMLVSRFLDGFSDLAVGYLVDQTKSPYGKTRVWILRMIIPFFLASVALFAVPQSWGDTAKLAYIFITYNLAITVVYTAINLPYGAMMTLMTQDVFERAKLSIFRVVLSTSGTTLALVATLPMVRFFGNDSTAWLYTMLILCGLATVLFFITFVNCKERVFTPPKPKVKGSSNLKGGLKNLFANKYWLMLTFAMLTMFGGDIIAGAANIYYFKYYLNDPEFLGNFTLVGTVIRLVLMVTVLQFCIRRFGKRNCILIAATFLIAGYMVRVVDPFSLTVNYLSAAVVGIGQGFLYATMWAMPADTVEYGEYITGDRNEGMVYAGSSFSTKVANGLGTAAAGGIINLGGYVASSAVQTEGAMDSILLVSSAVPALVFLSGAIVLLFYKLDREYPAIIQELTIRRAKAGN